MTSLLPEPWLRGPLEGIHGLLQPPARAFVMAREDVEAAVAGLTEEQVWTRPAGVACVGFHLTHLSGSTDRLLTYARGDTLSVRQFADLAGEREVEHARPSLATMLQAWRAEYAVRHTGQIITTAKVVRAGWP